MRSKLILAAVLLFLVILPLVSSQELWSFSNFRNRYAVYGYYICNVLGTRDCPNEMGWQGSQLIFQFTLNKTANLPGVLKFNFESSYFINEKPIDIYVNSYKIAKDFIVSSTGIYSVNFTRADVSPGTNIIRIIMKNAPVGYGRASAGFVLGQVSLESIDGTILTNCLKNSDCGTNGFTGLGVCSGLKLNQNYTTYTCITPGVNGHCSSSVSVKLVKTCTAPACSAFSSKYCKGNDVYYSRTCYNAGCSNGTCTSESILDEKKFQTCSYTCLNGACVSSLYSVKNKYAGTNLERRFYYGNTHFMTTIESAGSVAIRPHPGTDVNGWGSTLYLQPFLPGAVLKNSRVNRVTITKNGVGVGLSGYVSKITGTYGSWNSNLVFSFDNSTKKVSGNGSYLISLSGVLSNTTGDLNLLKIASNYLSDVPLLSGGIGDTGDMKEADVIGKTTFVWIPKIQPGHFPYDLTDSLSIDVKGNYNNVDTAAQGYAPIAAAYKPSLKVVLNSRKTGTSMIFGAIYDTSKSQQFWQDNVGITPLILKSSKDKIFNFDVQFESQALPDG